MNNYINLMSSQICYYEKVEVDKINVGKSQYFKMYHLCPIYYNIDGIKHNNLILKTPRLFVPHKIKKIGNKIFLELSFLSQKEDPGVLFFKNILLQIEKRIYKIIKRRRKFKVEKKDFVSILKCDDYYDTQKILIPVNPNLGEAYDINNKRIPKWEFAAPTYGFFIIQFKNIWIKENKWGLNLYTHGGLILPSQIVDPPPLPKMKYLFIDEQENMKIIGDDKDYQKFFKMKDVGVPLPAIKQKMMLAALNPDVIEYDKKTKIADIPALKSVDKPDKNKFHTMHNRINKTKHNSDSNSNNPLNERAPLAFNVNDLLSQSKKLNKVDTTKKPRRKTMPNIRSGMLVPSLNDITNAIKRLRPSIQGS